MCVLVICIDNVCECLFDMWMPILFMLKDNVDDNIAYVVMNLLLVIIIFFCVVTCGGKQNG
jgi:hypothetical protein